MYVYITLSMDRKTMRGLLAWLQERQISRKTLYQMEGGPFDKRKGELYKMGVRDLALEGERLRKKLEMKVALIF